MGSTAAESLRTIFMNFLNLHSFFQKLLTEVILAKTKSMICAVKTSSVQPSNAALLGDSEYLLYLWGFCTGPDWPFSTRVGLIRGV